MRLFGTWWLAGLIATGCAPSVSKDAPVDTTQATVAVFNPITGVLPLPSDLLKDRTTGRLAIPISPEDDASTAALKTGLNTLDGWSLNSTLEVPFSGPLDTSTLGNIMLIDLTKGPVAVTPIFQEESNTLYAMLSAPLSEGTTYLAVVNSDLLDINGDPVLSDTVFTIAKSEEPLVDTLGNSRYAAIDDATAAMLEPLRMAFGPMFDNLESQGTPRGAVAVAWSFTTQTVHASYPILAAMVEGDATVQHAESVKADVYPLLTLAGIPRDNLCDVHSGTMAITNLLTNTGTFGVDNLGAPVVTTTSVEYRLTTPEVGGNCDADWAGDKVAVFAHSLGRCKNDAFALADSLAQAGWAVLSVDGPRAGARTVGTLDDLNLDGCEDQPATPELIALGAASPNPFSVRDHMRQWGLELTQITAAAKAAPWTLAGLAEPTTPPATKVVLIGHSWGGIAALLAGSVGSAIDKVAVNAASAEFGAIFEPQVKAGIDAQLQAVGVDTSSTAGQAMLAESAAKAVSSFRWVMEPADPLYAAAAYPADFPLLVQLVSMDGDGELADAPLHDYATQTSLANAFVASQHLDAATVAKTTFVLTYDNAGTTTPICDDAAAAVAALLKPCVEDQAAAAYPDATKAYGGMQRQLVQFVERDVVCDPDISVTCN